MTLAREQFERRLHQLWPGDWHDVTVLAAVSGGADSVALLRALDSAGSKRPGRLVVAHFNHGLREEAADDESFVCELSACLDLQCIVGRRHHPATSSWIEEAARQARYEFFRATAAEVGARYVATAHTADDQAETVLHRIVRGTGIAGLAGMRRARELCPGVTLIRPLLSVRRSELLAYLQALEQPFREDATNAERRFTRNRLRHGLLPELARDYNSNVVEALLRLSQLAGEAQSIVDERVGELVRDVRFEANRVELEISRYASEPRYVVRELLVAVWRRHGWPEQAMGFDEWESLADLLLSPDPRAGTLRLMPGGVAVMRRGDTFVLERTQGATSLS
ncbi:MAG: tRNA lysidine(34) synthetase TilS [Pirellulales bacterium]